MSLYQKSVSDNKAHNHIADDRAVRERGKVTQFEQFVSDTSTNERKQEKFDQIHFFLIHACNQWNTTHHSSYERCLHLSKFQTEKAVFLLVFFAHSS